MSDGETLTIIGRCTEISEKNGWTTFHIDAGSKYPVRLSTKLEAIISKGRAVGDGTATWTYKEQESDRLNENTGKPFVNRYLNDVEAGEHQPAATAGGSPVSSGSHPAVSQGEKDRSITRMAVLKAASDLYAGTGDVDEVFKTATRMETWVYRDIDPVPFDSSVTAALTGDAPPAAEDDASDIPF